MNQKIKDLIREYVTNDSVIEILSNQVSIKYFSKEYLNAIRYKDIEYLYKLGRDFTKTNSETSSY